MIKHLRNLKLNGSGQRPVCLDLVFRQDGKPKPLLIFIHGFKGFKDWGHFNLMADEFANNGFVFAKFNFSCNGTTPEQPLDFADLEAFGQNNYMKELQELELVMNYCLNLPALRNERADSKVSLIGHSRGGGIAVLKAANDTRVSRLVTWASLSTFFNRYTENTLKEWKEKGVIYTYNTRTKQHMPLYRQFYDTLEEHAAFLDIPKAAASLSIPWLIAHGSADEAVPVNEALELKAQCPSATLLLVPGANHTFGATHPWLPAGLPEPASEVIARSIRFLAESAKT